ncbi:D-alanyl-D-alanine carboxypeptidase family protein [Gordonia liuliyuniae]|uniref:D-alanyl-D-alanine carboxypeptidase n=1 Tax=Gordonia liuliyuniae TaxID=2911517 RepID=A0ABS9IXP3_9ACTN|nr:D-alanyl-D-alanine carboxypeptidase family protein [Gordonia liuliyuniae]MCF8590347.1 D-alanyl-D-alanine carboxypeptidase [Gordonia liuliyuniae]
MSRSPAGRLASLLTAAVLVALPAVVGNTWAHADPDAVYPTEFVPAAHPDTADCPHQVHTPPAVDTSEAVAPGETTPTPLPVPTPAVGGEKLSGCDVVHDPAAGPLPTNLTSAGWLIADLDSGDVIAAKDPHGRYRPASTVKVLLALTVLDELDLDTTVTGTLNDYGMEGDSCGIGPGGKYTVRDLLTGLLMVSGNDCANALARELGGHDQTLAAMNAKAASLGAKDTRATTPSGLDAAGMSTSPYDEALIFRDAMANETFRHIVSLTTYPFPGFPPLKDVPGDKPHPGYTMGTSNTLLRDGFPGMLGGKTGYTDDALKTFVGAVERAGRTLLIVQMYGVNQLDNLYSDQAVRLLDYGFAAPAGTSIGSLADAAPDDAGTERSPTGDDVHTAWNISWIGVAAVVLIVGAAAWIAVRFGRRRR